MSSIELLGICIMVPIPAVLQGLDENFFYLMNDTMENIFATYGFLNRDLQFIDYKNTIAPIPGFYDYFIHLTEDGKIRGLSMGSSRSINILLDLFGEGNYNLSINSYIYICSGRSRKDASKTR